MRNKFLLLFTICCSLLSCEPKSKEILPVFERKQSMNKRIQAVFDANYLQKASLPKDAIDALQLIYESNNYKPFWVNDTLFTKNGKKWSQIHDNNYALGIPRNRLHELKIDSLNRYLVFKEIIMTLHFSQFYNDLKNGFFDKENEQNKTITYLNAVAFKALYNEYDTVTNTANWLSNKGSSLKDYKRLAKRLFYNSIGCTINDKSFEIPDRDKDSAACFKICAEALVNKNYLDSSWSNDKQFWNALSLFQTDHGLDHNGVIGKYTRSSLGESKQQEMDRAVLSLERWRWRSAFPSRFIWVNIPEYMLRIYYNDSLISKHRVVVGKPTTTTPQLAAIIHQVIALPFWTQPQSIATDEFLPAQKRNTNYARKHHYRVLRGETEVDPSSVNWGNYSQGNFPFRIRQDPGDDNALGLIKFEFHNKYGVYIHDTPQKKYFKHDIRAYSHGCVRCEMPDSLARLVLRRDDRQEMLPDSLDSIVFRKEHRPISLRKPIPVTIDYISVVVSEGGNLITYPDIYDRDLEYLKKMNLTK